MRFTALFMMAMVFGCDGTAQTTAEPTADITQELGNTWPPEPLGKTVEVAAGELADGGALHIRALVFIETLTGDSGAYVFAPLLNGEPLSYAQITLQRPYPETIIIEWVVDASQADVDGMSDATSYGTITAASSNCDSIVRASFTYLDIDTTEPQVVGVGVGRIRGPATITATVISVTVYRGER